MSAIAGWGIPNICPITESSTFCYKGEKLGQLSLATQKMLEFIATLKQMKIRFTIEHDTGTSCFEALSRTLKN